MSYRFVVNIQLKNTLEYILHLKKLPETIQYCIGVNMSERKSGKAINLQRNSNGIFCHRQCAQLVLQCCEYQNALSQGYLFM